MLSLDSPAWSTLTHAYGSAADIPAHLADVYRDPTQVCDWDKDPWFYLWSSLCHQGDIGTASIAAVPHLIAAALQAIERKELFNWDCIGLPASIEEARQNHPQITVDPEYFTHLRQLNVLIAYLADKRLPAPYPEAIAYATELLRTRRLLEDMAMPQPPSLSTDDLFKE